MPPKHLMLYYNTIYIIYGGCIPYFSDWSGSQYYSIEYSIALGVAVVFLLPETSGYNLMNQSHKNKKKKGLSEVLKMIVSYDLTNV